MQKHVKIYLEYYNTEPENIRCENCWLPAVDIHHIKPRSKFGKKTKYLQDDIRNLIALCRSCHERAHYRKQPYLHQVKLQDIHNKNLYEK